MCCPKGWKRFQEKCYYLSTDRMSWLESEQNCTGMGSHLVVINSEAEQVCAGLREGHSSHRHGARPWQGLRAPPCPAGEWGCPFWVPSALAPLWHQPQPMGTLPPALLSLHLMDIVFFPGVPLQLGKRSIY